MNLKTLSLKRLTSILALPVLFLVLCACGTISLSTELAVVKEPRLIEAPRIPDTLKQRCKGDIRRAVVLGDMFTQAQDFADFADDCQRRFDALLGAVETRELYIEEQRRVVSIECEKLNDQIETTGQGRPLKCPDIPAPPEPEAIEPARVVPDIADAIEREGESLVEAVRLLRWPCENQTKQAQGSSLSVGDAIFTAFHVVDKCPGDVVQHVLDDLAILQVGAPGECRNAVVGEQVNLYGFPGIKRRPDGLYEASDEVATDSGFVLSDMVQVSRVNLPPQKDVQEVRSHIVAVGWSGGGVFSSLDGRPVGMILGIFQGDEQKTLILPIETACEHARRAMRSGATS